MVLALDTHWIWDSWYLRDGDTWHGYFLKAPKSLGDPELRPFNVQQGHAISRDLRRWEHLGTHLEPSKGPSWDDCTTWTGSTLRDDAGGWHLFYTGSRRSEDGLYQRLGHAVSEDGHHWTRVGDGPCLDLTGPAAAYEADHVKGFWHDRAMRDPWVMKDPEGDGWLMYFTARGGGGGGAECRRRHRLRHLARPLRLDAAAAGLRRRLRPARGAAGVLPRGALVLPVLQRANQFSAAQAAIPGWPVTGTHYLIGEGPRGPWKVAEGPFLDGALPCRRYAARIFEHDGRLMILGFADRSDGGDFVGHVTDPDPVSVDDNGYLRVETRRNAEA